MNDPHLIAQLPVSQPPGTTVAERAVLRAAEMYVRQYGSLAPDAPWVLRVLTGAVHAAERER